LHPRSRRRHRATADDLIPPVRHRSRGAEHDARRLERRRRRLSERRA
jgi:hypothetical protein